MLLKILGIQRILTLCTTMSTVTRRQFLSQQLLCRSKLTDCNLKIVSRYIIYLKITKYKNSVNKTGILRLGFLLCLLRLSYLLVKVNFK